jgi:histidinol-phosphate aminotransferase
MPKLRHHLRGLKPYPIPIKSTSVSPDLLRLDANENFMELSSEVLLSATQASGTSQGYPDDFAEPLRRTIAEVHNIESEHIACGRGAMELISLLVSLYLEPGTNAVVTEFGYLYFGTAISYSGADVMIAPEKDLTVDVDSIISCINEATRIVFVANPGNPSGTLISNSELKRLRDALPEDVLLVIDEAYAEYADPDVLKPNFDLVESGNTVVLRTFSKIYGLAGYRVGWGYFPQLIANELRIIQQPNCVTHVSQCVAEVAMAQQEAVSKLRSENQTIRKGFSESLSAMGLLPIPSNTNFVLVKFENSDDAFSIEQFLRGRDVLVRPMKAYGLPSYLRITIGAEEDMSRVAEEIDLGLKQLKGAD